MTDTIRPPALSPAASLPSGIAPARRAAEALEAGFLAEMLKAAGVGEQDNSFSGSAGEAQFASFQRDALAQQIVRQGGIGLAEMIEAVLREQAHVE